MKKKNEEQGDELEQFQAYGEYSYEYRHAADEQRARAKREKQGVEQPDYSQPYEPAEEETYLSPEEALLQAQARAKRRSRAITGRLIFLLAIAVAVIIVLQGTVFRLTTVYVVGNVKKSAQQIAGASGLVKGLNIFAISEDEVRKNLSLDHTIIFLGLRKDYPNTIYLYISEREAVASTQWLGLVYTIDADGIVMEESNTLSLPPNMPAVTGLQVTNIHVGQKLELRDQEQFKAYYDIIQELTLQYYRDQVVEMNITNSDDLYLLTACGISVRLGNRQAMRAKIGALRTDLAYLTQLGKTTGVLDVTIPEDAKYRPES